MTTAKRASKTTKRATKTASPTRAKATAPRYGAKAKEKVGAAMHELKHGKLRSGSGQKVTNPKQAVAIGLSEARKAGGKVPPKPR
jgi:hypothetical protein